MAMSFNFERRDSDRSILIDTFDRSFLGIPRFKLFNGPTPLEHLGKLASGATLWMKRDDLLSVGLGGNKVRKLEFIIADALTVGATDVVTVGAEQSNHLRLTSACCAKAGLKSHLFFASPSGKQSSGNQDLAKLFGGKVYIVKGDLKAATEAALEFTNSLKSDHLVPYYIEPGGSVPLGALGYMLCYSEISFQLEKLGIQSSYIYLPVSTMGTLAGLAAGASMMLSRKNNLGLSVSSLFKIRGIVVDPDFGPYPTGTNEKALDLTINTLEILNKSEVLNSNVFQLLYETDISGTYGKPTQISDAAFRFAARQYGLLLDRTYSAKAFGQLLADDLNGKFKSNENIIFLHTGGLGANFSTLGTSSLGELINPKD